MIFLLRSRHLGSPVQSSLEPCCTAGTTPSCAGAARFNVRRRAAAAAKWHRVNMDGSSATISKRARGANPPRGRFSSHPSSRLPLSASWTRGTSTWHTMVPRERRARLACLLLLHCAPAQVRGASASACTDEDSHCKQWQKMGECENNPGFMRAAMWKTRPSGSLEACLQCHGAPQAARSSGQPRPISRSVLAISPDRACLRRRHLTCALTCGTCAKQRARGRRHECSDIGADAHVEGDVTAIMERLEQRTELGPEVLSPPLPPWRGPPPPPQPQPQPRTLSCCLLARASARSVHLKALHYPRPRCSRATRG